MIALVPGADNQHWSIDIDGNGGRAHSLAGSQVTCTALIGQLQSRAAQDRAQNPNETDERSLMRWLHSEAEPNLPPLGGASQVVRVR